MVLAIIAILAFVKTNARFDNVQGRMEGKTGEFVGYSLACVNGESGEAGNADGDFYWEGIPATTLIA